MSIRFVLMKHQINPHTGKAGLYCRITIDGIHAPEFSTGVFVEPANWDSKS